MWDYNLIVMSKVIRPLTGVALGMHEHQRGMWGEREIGDKDPIWQKLQKAEVESGALDVINIPSVIPNLESSTDPLAPVVLAALKKLLNE